MTRGFTLLECLVYLGLFGVLMNGTLEGMFALTASGNRVLTKAFLDTEGNFILQKIHYDLEHSIPIGSLASLTSSDVTIENFLSTQTAASTTDPAFIQTFFSLSTHSASNQKVSESFSSTYYPIP
jgi:prepilin-type N-terminal cleavage/methylation domain-containing protein